MARAGALQFIFWDAIAIIGDAYQAQAAATNFYTYFVLPGIERILYQLLDN